MRVRVRNFTVVAIMNNQRIAARFPQHLNDGESVKTDPMGVARFEIITNPLRHLIRQAEMVLGGVNEPAAVLKGTDADEIRCRQSVLTCSQQCRHDAKRVRDGAVNWPDGALNRADGCCAINHVGFASCAESMRG